MFTLTFLRKCLRAALLLSFVFTGGIAMAVEEPVFELTMQEDAFEVRIYPALVAAQVNARGTRGEAVNAGFRLLADYIFGNNKGKQTIAMTAPVMQAPGATPSQPTSPSAGTGTGAGNSEVIAMTAPVLQTQTDGAWTIQFVMPKTYTLQTLPTPNNAQVRLVQLPPTRFAVVRFSGLAGDADIAEKTAALNTFMDKHQLRRAGAPTLARYNPPWTLWFMRRNEIMVPLEP
jgi:hypothetical protein